MKNVKIFRFLLILGFCGTLGLNQAHSTPETDFTTQAQKDYQTMADYVNGQFAKSMGFITSLGWNTPPGVFDILNGPHIEVGFGGGADLMGLPNSE